MNPEDSKQIAAYDLSEFRKRLMECLDKPYDQKEYDELLLKASKQTKKERHLETRQGVVKSYHSKGLSKSYLDMYPGRSIFSQVFFWLLRFSSFIYKNGSLKFDPTYAIKIHCSLFNHHCTITKLSLDVLGGPTKT